MSTLSLLLSLLAASPAAAPAELVLNDAYQAKAAELIGSARKSVTVCAYLISGGGGVSEIERCLASAAKREVAVWVLLEQSAEKDDSVTGTNREAAKRLKAAGVPVAFDCPERRTHIKAIVVDARYSLLGSHNLTYSALANNNEASVVIDDPDMAMRLEKFIRSLEEGTCRE